MATVVGLAGVVRFLFWTSGRGFDITDEGYYFIGARHPADAVISVTSSQYELSLLFAAVRWNIPLYRVVGFCITVVAAFVLAAGLDAWRRRMSPGGSRSWTYLAAEAGAIAAGSLLGNSWLLTSPSYNTVTNWGLSLGAGAVLVTLAIGDANRVASIWLGVMGLALGATFFAKFTAALAVGAVFTVVLLAWPLVPFRTRVRWLLPAVSGFALFAAFYFIVIQSPVAWVRMVRLGIWAAATQSPLHGGLDALLPSGATMCSHLAEGIRPCVLRADGDFGRHAVRADPAPGGDRHSRGCVRGRRLCRVPGDDPHA
jgi:hypothetical protein